MTRATSYLILPLDTPDNRPVRLLTIALALSLLFPSVALAAPIVALDVRPEVHGVQSSLNVGPGQTFSVDLVLIGLDAATPLQGFQVELALGGGVLTALDVLDGGFLEPPIAELRREIAPTSIRFAEISLGPASTDSFAVLARYVIRADELGNGSLSLPLVLLSGPFGAVVQPEDIRGAEITVPEPLVGVLLAALCALLPICRARP
jgi:hypothetical protein